VVLFVRLCAGETLTEELRERICTVISEKASPRHVPAKIIQAAEIPYTINMEKMELAVRKVIHGEPVMNRDALANPKVLELYRELPELEE
jgi:acetoacetyl-CoA synthetase